QNIYARFLSPSNTWLTGDVLVSASTNSSKLDAALTTLANGNLVVVWSSIAQRSTTSMQDVYGQIFSPVGQKIGGQFPINQFAIYNQRTPAIAALANGGFVVVWVSEQQRSSTSPTSGQYYLVSQLPRASVDIYARLYSADGTPVGNEFLVNTSNNT